MRALAKLTLSLRITGLRADGFHLIDAEMVTIDLADTLEFADGDGLDIASSFDGVPAADDNLVCNALRAAGRTAHVRLTKRIPPGAGLGGGSADAAAALQVLIDLWRVTLPIDELFELAARLGADVPMCLAGRAALVSGIGERLVPAPPLPACGLLLVNPALALPTADVFAARHGEFARMEPLARPWSDLASLVDVLAARGNDLTAAATALCPAIADVLDFLRNSPAVRYAAMSGSGATCFALYDTPGAAERAAADLPAPWWRHAGTLVS